MGSMVTIACSTFDYALLGCLGAGAAWYFLFREKKEEPATPSYVIQPASMPAMSMSANRYRERQGLGPKVLTWY